MDMQGEIDRLERENMELRVSKNMLIDRAMAQEKRLQEQEIRITELENGPGSGQDRPGGESEGKEAPGRTRAAMKIQDMFRKIRFFFYCVESVLYRSWLGVWIVLITIILYRFLTGNLQ